MATDATDDGHLADDGSPGRAQPERMTDMSSAATTTESVLELIERWVDAELRGDAAALDALAARDLVLVGPLGFVLDRAQWVDRHRRPGGLAMQSLEWTDATARQFGDAAIVIGTQTQQATYAGRRSDGRFRVTLVCVREDEQWRLASLHFSPIGGPPPFAAADRGRPAEAEGGVR
jgi:ketosteroid isomerase-like protein